MLVNESAEYPEPDEDDASIRLSCTNLKVLKAPCLMHILLKRRSNFVLCKAMAVI